MGHHFMYIYQLTLNNQPAANVLCAITHDDVVGLTLTLGFRPKKALMGLPNGDLAGEGQLDPRSIDNKYQALVNILCHCCCDEQKFQGIILRNIKL